MPKSGERRSSTVPENEPEVFQKWVKLKEDQKMKEELLKAMEGNHRMLEEHLENEQRKILNHISYVQWYEKKNQQLKMKKLEEKMEEEKRKEQEEAIEQKRQQKKNLNYNAWLEKKDILQKKTREQMLKEKKMKETEEEMKQREKEHAEISYRMWMDMKSTMKREEEKRKKKEREEKEKEMKEKKYQNEEMFKDWKNRAKHKPKPVKSNLGFTSLACRNIGFINPIPWKNILDDEKETDTENPEVIELFKRRSLIASTVTSQGDIFDDKSISFNRTADWVKNSNRISKTVSKGKEKEIKNCSVSSQTIAKNTSTIKLDRNYKSAPVCTIKKKQPQIQLEKLLQIKPEDLI